MATRTTTTGYFTWRNAFIAAGLAVAAPYIYRRLMPLISDSFGRVNADDVALAGRDSVRDVADDLGVGGVSGSINRGINRVTDHLSH